MHLTRITSAKRVGFSKTPLHVKRDRPRQTSAYMKQKSSFFIAAISLVAFVSGNMMGEHGWYAFWKSVMGKYDDSLITYTGTLPPIALVPDYSRWSSYGGSAEKNTYRQVPKDILIPLPTYDASAAKNGTLEEPARSIYSVGHMGSYDTGHEADGSHPGVDIRVPEGTPVRAIANGIVTSVREDAYGFGKLIVIRHPHMPDPDKPSRETVLHSVYAHLSAQLVSEGDIIEKGQEIALSGQTGFATGPHLHFQVDRDSAPWHPYWPFTSTEAREAGWNTAQAINHGLHQERGFEYTVHPMLLVQSNLPPAKNAAPRTTVARAPQKRLSSKELRDARRNSRLVAIERKAPAAPPAVVKTETVALADAPAAAAAVTIPAPTVVSPSAGSVVSLDIQSEQSFTGRAWMNVRITLLDAQGHTADASTLKNDLYLRTAYGEAEFKPASLSALDFEQGSAVVQMLPRGQRTVVINIEPFKIQSRPIKYTGN